MWTICCGVLRPQVSDAVWRSTFHDVKALQLTNGTLHLAVPNSVVRDRIEGAYLSLVRNSLQEAASEPLTVTVAVQPSASQHDPLSDFLGEQPIPGLFDESISRSPERRLLSERSTPPAPHATSADEQFRDATSRGDEVANPKYTFDAFVTGPSNRFAHAAALSVAETPGRSYNPLFIYGEAGLGKTHLLQAIGQYVRQNYPHYVVRYVSSETFLNEFVESIRLNTNSLFKKRYRDVNVLLVDDIQFIEAWKETQVEFFHTFNALQEANRQIVLSSDRPPDAIDALETRLRSRFKMGLITDIQPPDLETRLAILRKKAEREPSWIPDDVLEFIAANITNNIRELEGALIRVAAFANLTHEELTADLAKKVLADIVGDRQPRPVTPQLILEKTSEMFSFSIEEIQGKSRRRPLVTARQVAMYVMREITDLSYPGIAMEFGGRDHTTVIHSVEKVKALMRERQIIYEQVTELMQIIRRGE
ncbi:MAG: chromosomal replication initiator protein DnaA [Acidimicrobiales bacterium]